jgi:hypothetical protein
MYSTSFVDTLFGQKQNISFFNHIVAFDRAGKKMDKREKMPEALGAPKSLRDKMTQSLPPVITSSAVRIEVKVSS